MNHLPIRMMLYTVAALAAAAGFGTFDPVAGTLTLDMNEIAMSLAAAATVNGLVFWRWGVKPATEGDAK